MCLSMCTERGFVHVSVGVQGPEEKDGAGVTGGCEPPNRDVVWTELGPDSCRS